MNCIVRTTMKILYILSKHVTFLLDVDVCVGVNVKEKNNFVQNDLVHACFTLLLTNF